MDKEEIKEIELLPSDEFKEFYVLVNYYEGIKPYVNIVDNIEIISTKYDKIYKIRIPFNNI